MVGVEVVDADVGGVVDGGRARRETRVHQVLGDFGLPVDDDVATGKRGQVHAVPPPAEEHIEPVVYQAFPRHALAHTRLAQQVHGPLLEHAGTDAAQDVLRAPAFDDERLDASPLEQLPQEEPRRTGADDGYLDAAGVQRRPSSLYAISRFGLGPPNSGLTDGT